MVVASISVLLFHLPLSKASHAQDFDDEFWAKHLQIDMYPWTWLQTHISHCPCVPMGHQFGGIPLMALPCILLFRASSSTAPTREGSHPAVFTQP